MKNSYFDMNHVLPDEYNSDEYYLIFMRTSDLIVDSTIFQNTQTVQDMSGIIEMVGSSEQDLILTNTQIKDYFNNQNQLQSLILIEKPTNVYISNVNYSNNGITFFSTYETDITDFSSNEFYFEINNCIFDSSVLQNNSNNNGILQIYSQGPMILNFNNITIKNCIITKNNTAAIYIHQDYVATVTFDNLQIFNTTTYGAPMLHLDSNANIQNSEFISNVASYGMIGSFDTVNQYQWQFEQCTFMDNYSPTVAAAIYSFQNDVIVDQCEFRDNYAQFMAGDIAVFGDTFELTNSNLIGSQTNGSAGSLWIAAGFTSQRGQNTYILNNTFENISAKQHGGAILYETSDITAIHIESNKFKNCQATYGPVINIINQHDISQTFTFSNNSINNVDNSNNDGMLNSYSMLSFPIKLEIRDVSNSTNNNDNGLSTICPDCVKTVELTATDLFDQQWKPFTFCHFNQYTLIEEDCITVEIYQSLLFNFDYLENSDVTFEVKSQTNQFMNANGNETFTIYPLQYDKSFRLSIFSQFESINPAVLEMKATKCNLHYLAEHDPDTNSFTCFPCQYGEYRLEPTATENYCLACPNNVICNGGDNDIYVLKDYYLAEYDNKFYSYQCMPDACCQESRCLYSGASSPSETSETVSNNHQSNNNHNNNETDNSGTNNNNQNQQEPDSSDNYESSHLCPSNRDDSSPLCGKCAAGSDTSVVQGTESCRKCKDSSGHIIPVIIVLLLFSLLILYWGRKHPSNVNLSSWELYIMRIVLFFYQMLPFIELQTNSRTGNNRDDENIVVNIITSLFNAEFPNDGEYYLCIFDGLTNAERLMSQYSIPVICVFWVLVLSFISNLKCCQMRKYRFFASTAITRCAILVYAQVIRTSFQLISCRQWVDSDIHIMYFAANTECFQIWHIIPFSLIVLCAGMPIFFAYWLYSHHGTVLASKSSIYHILTLPYKPQCYWYQIFQMFRLFLMSLLISISIEEMHRLVWMRAFLLFFLVAHLHFMPFVTHKKTSFVDINHCETLILVLLFLLTMLADFHVDNDGKSEDTIEILFDIILYIPVVVGVIVAVSFVYYKLRGKKHRKRRRKTQSVGVTTRVRLEKGENKQVQLKPQQIITPTTACASKMGTINKTHNTRRPKVKVSSNSAIAINRHTFVEADDLDIEVELIGSAQKDTNQKNIVVDG